MTDTYYARHREDRLAYQGAYDAAHRTAVPRREPRTREAIAEYQRAYQAVYRKTHRHALLEYGRSYGRAHRGKRRLWRAANRDKLRNHWREADAKRRGARACEHPACLALGPAVLAWQTNGHVCYLCGTPVWRGVNLHMDHVVPIAKGGIHCADNLRPACAKCNTRKGAGLKGEQISLTPSQLAISDFPADEPPVRAMAGARL